MSGNGADFKRIKAYYSRIRTPDFERKWLSFQVGSVSSLTTTSRSDDVLNLMRILGLIDCSMVPHLIWQLTLSMVPLNETNILGLLELSADWPFKISEEKYFFQKTEKLSILKPT